MIWHNVKLAPFTTLKLGGPAEYFSRCKSNDEIGEALDFAKKENLLLTIIGGGSNILISDEGIKGLVLKIETKGLKLDKNKVVVAAGEELDRVVDIAVKNELSGMEHLAGIPGTIGGAIFGNAGAYGRAMQDIVSEVLILDGTDLKVLSNKDCKFSYRESIFKRKEWIILEATLELLPSHRAVLERIARGYRIHRLWRFGKKSLRAPGSFFKNIDVEKCQPEVLSRLPRFAISNGKIQAGWLLEHCGALGARQGGIRIAPFHANLFINEGGTSADFLALALKFWHKVYENFGIKLEPEVQLLGFDKNPFS